MRISPFSAIELCMAVMLCFIFYASTITYYGNPRQNHIFSMMIIMNIISLVADAFYHSLYGAPALIYCLIDIFIIIPFYAIEYLFYDYIAEYISFVTSTQSRFTQICRRIVLVMSILAAIYWLLFSSVFGTSVPRLLYYLGQIPGWGIMILTIFTILLFRRQFEPVVFRYLIVYNLIPAFGMILRNFNIGGNTQHIGISISLLLLHLFVHRRQSERLSEQAVQLEQNRNYIVRSQIKPHFIYNSLNTIYYLCEQDPKLAQKAIIEFSEYLRGNLDTIDSDKPVPFDQELAHIHHYLYLEQLRFSDELNVVYDIHSKDFTVPPLSVQLAVENAVKHGIGRKTGGGTVTISSYETDDAHIVCVKDDGVGFDPSVLNKQNDKQRRHIGIQNMIFRIETLSSGKVDIKSAPNEGTCVTIQIPKTQ